MKDTLDRFANYVLTDEKLKKLMKRKDFNEFKQLKEFNGEMSFELADKIARVIKRWAISKGATHYTHWFFPLTGKYAEKQISFLDYGENGEFIKRFNGGALIKGETDASSFPSGGERLTFEARGYTVWDYSSPVFIKSDDNGNKVLYIPTAFCTYNGIAVDEKTPLLRASEYLNKEATKLLNLLGYHDVRSVVCNVGCEQEYFLVKKELFEKRKDLVFTGRTLLGSDAIKSQETSHHYLGQIKPSVSAFMHDLSRALWELGIMAKIQHNEVAPSQHEIVAVYSQANIVSDQNSLLMEVMNKIANRHGYKVLFHEKPYKNVNGSGKHNNWSICTNTGINLLDYNKADSVVFMLAFTSVISAIDKHYDLLKMATSSLSNDLRLGGHEAPPSVISVFIGEDMVDMLNNFVENDTFEKQKKSVLDMKTSLVAKMYRDTCDRNRTSPFAFTGNKFEFRMVGSSQSIALSNTILATIVADEFRIICEKLVKSDDKLSTLKRILVENIKAHSRIIFNGNSYDEDWKRESKRRGLADFKTCIDCYKCLLSDKNQKLFEDSGVLSKTELKVRYETYLQFYINDCITEAKTLCDIIKRQVLFSIQNQINYYVDSFNKICSFKSRENTFLKTINKWIEIKINLSKCVEELSENIKSAELKTPLKEKTEYCKNIIVKNMRDIRVIYDSIETDFIEQFKPFPDYNDLLF